MYVIIRIEDQGENREGRTGTDGRQGHNFAAKKHDDKNDNHQHKGAPIDQSNNSPAGENPFSPFKTKEDGKNVADSAGLKKAGAANTSARSAEAARTRTRPARCLFARLITA